MRLQSLQGVHLSSLYVTASFHTTQTRCLSLIRRHSRYCAKPLRGSQSASLTLTHCPMPIPNSFKTSSSRETAWLASSEIWFSAAADSRRDFRDVSVSDIWVLPFWPGGPAKL